jgi:hypothetical protein
MKVMILPAKINFRRPLSGTPNGAGEVPSSGAGVTGSPKMGGDLLSLKIGESLEGIIFH